MCLGKKGDNIGVALDLTVPIMTFFFNGVKVPGYFRNFNLDGMFFPVIREEEKPNLQRWPRKCVLGCVSSPRGQRRYHTIYKDTLFYPSLYCTNNIVISVISISHNFSYVLKLHP